MCAILKRIYKFERVIFVFFLKSLKLFHKDSFHKVVNCTGKNWIIVNTLFRIIIERIFRIGFNDNNDIAA